MLNVSDILRKKRLQQGVSQTELANKTGMTQSTIARIESGNNIPSLESIERIAKALNLELNISLKKKKEAENV